MKLLRSSSGPQRGAALLLSFLVLIVLVLIVSQIRIGTMTDARVARNDIGISNMEMAISSALLEIEVQLIEDAEQAAEGGDEGGAGLDPLGGGMGGMGGLDGLGAAGEEEQAPPSDSREDAWGRPQRSEINEIGLRILVQDENSKYNVLNMLNEDEEEAEAAYLRIARILDLCREGTDFDLSARDGEDLASAMREHMLQRDTSYLPRPELLTDTVEEERLGLPLTLREFGTLELFQPHMFQEFRDRDGLIVHSIGTFLTVWSSPGVRANLSGTPAGSQRGVTEEQAAAASLPGGDDTTGLGYTVNVNTAPSAVLHGLFDDRDVPARFWDDVVEYRNLRDEEAEENSEEEPQFDEFGEEVYKRQIFDTLEELSEVLSWDDLSDEYQTLVQGLLDTESHVFSVYLTARRMTGDQDEWSIGLTAEEAAQQEEEGAAALILTVRSVVWRRTVEEEVVITPIVPWEVIDHVPYEVQDYPEEDR